MHTFRMIECHWSENTLSVTSTSSTVSMLQGGSVMESVFGDELGRYKKLVPLTPFLLANV